jgi:hypothetical protein
MNDYWFDRLGFDPKRFIEGLRQKGFVSSAAPIARPRKGGPGAPRTVPRYYRKEDAPAYGTPDGKGRFALHVNKRMDVNGVDYWSPSYLTAEQFADYAKKRQRRLPQTVIDALAKR